jgi:hypothetical protein
MASSVPLPCELHLIADQEAGDYPHALRDLHVHRVGARRDVHLLDLGELPEDHCGGNRGVRGEWVEVLELGYQQHKRRQARSP